MRVSREFHGGSIRDCIAGLARTVICNLYAVEYNTHMKVYIYQIHNHQIGQQALAWFGKPHQISDKRTISTTFFFL